MDLSYEDFGGTDDLYARYYLTETLDKEEAESKSGGSTYVILSGVGALGTGSKTSGKKDTLEITGGALDFGRLLENGVPSAQSVHTYFVHRMCSARREDHFGASAPSHQKPEQTGSCPLDKLRIWLGLFKRSGRPLPFSLGPSDCIPSNPACQTGPSKSLFSDFRF